MTQTSKPEPTREHELVALSPQTRYIARCKCGWTGERSTEYMAQEAFWEHKVERHNEANAALWPNAKLEMP